MSDPVRELLERAGRVAMTSWRADAIRVQDKSAPGDAVDFVSEADLAVDRILREGLGDLFPGVCVISEEGAVASGAPPSDAFLVDPIDGTHNFLAGNRWWTLALARTRGEEVEEAWIHHPPSGTTTHAVRGGVTTHDGLPVKVSNADPRTGLISLSLSRELVPLLLGADRFGGLRALGSHAMCLGMTARGQLLLHAGGGKPWDVAAGFLLVERAGGRVCSLDGGPRSPFDARAGLAGAPAAVEAVLALFADP